MQEKQVATQGSQDFIQLPKRPFTGYQSSHRTFEVISNHFEMNLRDIKNVYIFALEIQPRVEHDNRKLKEAIINSVRSEIQQAMGIFVLTGFTMYSSQKPNFQNYQKFQTNIDYQDYVILIKHKTVINVSDIQNPDKRVSMKAMNFFNILVKFFLKQLKFFETGRTSRFYDPTKKELVPGTDLTINHGYETAVNWFERGLFLRIDLTHKVIRSGTVLEQIKATYFKYQNACKEEKRNMVKEALVGKIVVANYGNNRYWKIEDILFDRSCTDFMLEQEDQKKSPTGSPKQSITLAEYYRSRYKLTIKDAQQPLLMSSQSRTKQTAYLVPEFCTMTGIPDDFNIFQRKKVTNTCKKTAQERMTDLENISRRMVEETNQDKFMNPKAISDAVGIELDKKAVRFQAKQLQAPKILFGNGESMEQRDSNFMFKQSVFDKGPHAAINLAILHFKDFNINDFLRNMQRTGQSMQIPLQQPKCINLGEYQRKIYSEIEFILQNKIQGRFQAVLIVLPGQMKHLYGKIKQLCLCEIQGGVISQVVYQSTLEKKSYQQICSKLLHQIAAKVGTTLWIPQPPKEVPKKTMMIGIAVENNKVEKNCQVVSVCATVNNSFSQFYTKTQFQQRGKEVIENVRQVIRDCVMAYFKKNKEVPENIIFFRDGVQESQFNLISQIELQEMLKSFKELNANYSPKLAFVCVQKNPQQKFFKVDQRDNINNPPFGTLIDSTIVSNFYDFYLVAQNVNVGTAKPTHYRVIYDDTGMDQGLMQELVFSQCFNYMNWSGAVRIPAPVMYAQKLAALVSQSTGKAADKDLAFFQYYL